MKFFIFCYSLALFGMVSCSSEEVVKESPHLTHREVESIDNALELEIKNHYPMIKNHLINRYVNSLGQTIVSHSKLQMPPLPYEFRVVKSDEINAFSLPGGAVYLTLGVLRHLELEGYVATILAHELAHQALGHSLIIWQRRLAIPGAFREYFATPIGTWNDRFLGVGGFLYYPKDMEKEADQLSLVLLYRANYDPRIVLSYLQNLIWLQKKFPKETKAMLSLQAPIKDRINWVKEQLTKLPPLKEPKLNSSAFMEVKHHLHAAEEKKQKDKKK